MLDKIKKKYSWDADCTVLLVRAIFAIAAVVGIVWYYRKHLYGDPSRVLDNWNAMVANSEPPPIIWETIISLVKGIISLIPSIVIAFLPLLGFAIFWLAFWGFTDWLDTRKPRNMNTQVKYDIEGHPVRVGNDSEEIGIHVNKNAPLRRSPVRYVGERI